jgi:hypothetical protein
MDILALVFRIIGILSIPLTLVAIVLMIRSLRHEQQITARSLIIQLATSPIFLAVYAWLLGVSVSLRIAVPMLIVGLAVGVVWGHTTRLRLTRRAQVAGRRSIWYLAVWGLTFTVTQGLALWASSEVVAHALSTMYFSTGAAAGMNGYLLFRYWRLLSGAPAPLRCPACGAVGGRGQKFCVRCGTALAPPPAPAPAAANPSAAVAACPGCGYANRPGTNFCINCGRRLA